MTVRAIWQRKYALSIRKGKLDLTSPIDLSKLGATLTGATDVNAASHTDAGVPSSVIVTLKEYGGDQHFNGDTLVFDDINAEGGVMGQPQSASAGNITYIYGQPVVGSPAINIGQNILEFRKTDGNATGRIASAIGSDDTSGSDYYRGGQEPTFTADTIVTAKSLGSLLATFFQNGFKEDISTPAIKVARFPKASDGSAPLYLGTWLIQMSPTGADSHLLSDAVCRSLNFSVNVDGVLTASSEYVGRIAITGKTASTLVGGVAAANTQLDDGMNYLMTDAQVVISNAAQSTYYLTEISDFSLSMTCDVAVQRYNNLFPLRFIMGGYNASGSITIPWSSGALADSILGSDYFQELLTTAGATGQTPTPNLDDITIAVYWLNAKLAANGGASGSAQSLETTVDDNRDLHFQMNAVVSNVEVIGDIESELQISFDCRNKFSTSDVLTNNAVKIAYKDDVASVTGLNTASTLYGTATA